MTRILTTLHGMSAASITPKSSTHGRFSHSRRRLDAYEWGLIAGALVVTFVAHISYGANKSVLGLVLASAEAGLLILALASRRFAGDLWAVRRALYLPGALFIAVLIIAAHPLYLGNARGLEDLSGVTAETIKLAGLSCVFMVGCILGTRTNRGETFLKLSGVFLGLYALYSVVAFRFTPDRLLFGSKIMFLDRLTGTFGSANSVATLMGMGVVLNATSALASGGSRIGKRSEAIWSGVALGAALVCGAALLLTASRGGFIATIAGLAVIGSLILLRNPRWPIKRITIITTLAAAVGVGFVASNSFLGKRLSETSLKIDRFDILKAHWPAAASRPIWGFGAGNFDAVNNQVLAPKNYKYYGTLGRRTIFFCSGWRRLEALAWR